MASVDSALEKALAGERISKQEGLFLLSSSELQRIALAADRARRRMHPEGVVSFLIDRNINYTNVCVARCTFCNFYRKPNHVQGYLLPKDVIFKKIEETLALGGTGILLQGGMNPELKIDYYEDLLSSIRSKYEIHLHCFSPPEIVVLAKLSKLTIRESIRRLSQAGLSSIPGGGAEILTDRMRKEISPGKCTADEWLDVMRTAHEEGLKTSATMMFGAGETGPELVEHLDRIRSLQDETGGFFGFTPWNVQLKGTLMEQTVRETISPVEYLKVLSLSRIFLDNVKNIQVSWLTQGLVVGQLALHFGANDVGSIMIEENVMSVAGASHAATRDELIELIERAGFIPAQRNTTYSNFEPRTSAAGV
jgi:cyclic dehypoxanthinyl futalosine synthase